MRYACLITVVNGEQHSQFWTAPIEEKHGWGGGGKSVASVVTTKIKSDNAIVLKDTRPINASDTDGIETILNWRYVAGVAAFPVFT